MHSSDGESSSILRALARGPCLGEGGGNYQLIRSFYAAIPVLSTLHTQFHLILIITKQRGFIGSTLSQINSRQMLIVLMDRLLVNSTIRT